MFDLLTSPDGQLSYTLRYSRKAKYMQICISHRGLEVIVPQKKPPSQALIKEFIHKKRSWIEKHLKQLTKEDYELPKQINLNALNTVWDVYYLATSSRRIKWIANNDRQLKLMGCINDTRLCLKILRHWLKNMATQHLTKELEYLSHITGLQFNRLSIRNNITRWGSCSSKGHINLCCKILFLSPQLMRHVLLHELCHTKHMNHGSSFWTLLIKHDPFAIEHTKKLKNERNAIPRWLHEM